MRKKKQRIPRRRRQQNKTDYEKRLKMLKSGKPRLVARKTNTKIIAQLVQYRPDGDRVVVSAYSSELEDHGWEGGFKNTTAAYLTGLLLAERADDVEEAVLDIGLNTPDKGSVLFAVAQGATDGGLEIPVSEEIVPSQDRIEGEHLEKDTNFDEVKSEIQGES